MRGMILSGVVALLAACNTVEGVGRDLSQAGGAVQREAAAAGG